jgi:hypothetical protein
MKKSLLAISLSLAIAAVASGTAQASTAFPLKPAAADTV